MALAAMAGAKPSFKGSLEQDQQAYLASNVCADDGSAALDGCRRAARQHVKPSPPLIHHILPIPRTANPLLSGERDDWEVRLVVKGAATHWPLLHTEKTEVTTS